MTDNGRYLEFIARYPLLGTIGDTPMVRVDLSGRIGSSGFGDDLHAYVTEVIVPDGARMAGKLLGEIKNAVDADFDVVGLIRDERRYEAPSTLQEVKAGDVLIVEADPEDLDELIAATGFEIAGSDWSARRGDDLQVYVKLENLNPGGSIKDRPVLRMMVEAVLAGDLPEKKTLIDSTSGNAGIAYAMIGAVIGRKVELVMPGNASEERKKRVLAHGATIIETDPLLGYDEAMREVKRRYQADPDRYFFCNQYANDHNWIAHYETTATEILRQMPDLTHFVAGVGTGGTITGVGRRLKEHDPDIQVICIEPGDWRGIEGLKPLDEDNLVPEILDESVIDERVPVGLDEAVEMAKAMAGRGVFVGQSSGAYLVAAVGVATTDAAAQKGARVVTIFNDLGERYFSTGMWD